VVRAFTYFGYIVLCLSIFSSLGCQKKANSLVCKNNEDCRMDATGQELSAICHMGKCEECAEDTDCTDLKQCVKNHCVSACQASADCGPNERCEENYCMAVKSEGDQNSLAQGECHGFDDILFDFDRFEVKSEFKMHLEKVAKCMESNPGYSLRINGHGDERGPPAYNAVLAQKRADAAKSYLQATWGIASNRIKTISYGDLRPKVKESNEYAWSQNRRDEFEFEDN
jgi:outer membrane protein OmpA-like peptidoglycan-associated protein